MGLGYLASIDPKEVGIKEVQKGRMVRKMVKEGPKRQ